MATRKQRAEKLLERLQTGPIPSTIGVQEYTPQHAIDDYRRWADSWILTDVCALIPELREKLDTFGYFTRKE